MFLESVSVAILDRPLEAEGREARRKTYGLRGVETNDAVAR